MGESDYNNYRKTNWFTESTASYMETSRLGKFVGDCEYYSFMITSGSLAYPYYNKSVEHIGGFIGDGYGVKNERHDNYWDWDPTRVDQHRGGHLDPETLYTSGRTTLISIDSDGNISYPENHYKNHWGGHFLDGLLKPTKYNGYRMEINVPDDKIIETKHFIYDKAGQIPIDEIGPVWTFDVDDDGGGPLRLKVVRN